MRDIKLRKNEVVHCQTFDLACRVCGLAKELDLKWYGGSEYHDVINFTNHYDSTCYDFNKGTVIAKSDCDKFGATVISALEWLNRHNIFIPGQEVLARDSEEQSWRVKIYVSPYLFVRSGHHTAYYKGNPYSTIQYKEWKTKYSEWPERVSISIDGGEPFLINKSVVESLKPAEVESLKPAD